MFNNSNTNVSTPVISVSNRDEAVKVLRFRFDNSQILFFDLSDLVVIHNEYCDLIKDYDSIIYKMDEFDDLFDDFAPSYIASMVSNGDFSYNHDYFFFTVYGVKSINSYYDIIYNFCFSEVAEYAIDNNYDFGYPEIREVLDDYIF